MQRKLGRTVKFSILTRAWEELDLSGILWRRSKEEPIFCSTLNSWVCSSLFSSINQLDIQFTDTVGQHSNWGQCRWKLNLELLSSFIVTASFLQRSVITILFGGSNREGKKIKFNLQMSLSLFMLSLKVLESETCYGFWKSFGWLWINGIQCF